MSGINKVILVGRLGADPDLRFTPLGIAVSNFTIATSDSWKDKESGKKQERVEWHRIVAWRRLAEICGEYLRKGSQVYIEGKLQTKAWKDKEGNKRYTTEILANVMQMLGSPNRNTRPRDEEDPTYQTENRSTNPEDDIPF